MSTTEVKTLSAPPGEKESSAERTFERLLRFLPGVVPQPGEPVQISVPGLGDRIDERSWTALLRSEDPTRRRLMAEYIRAFLRVNRMAREQSVSLRAIAEQHGEAARRTLERAWVAILGQNRELERSVWYCAKFFENLETSAGRFLGKTAILDVTAEELGTPAGLARLSAILGSRVNFPDPRDSYGYVSVQGWTGSPEALERIGRRTHEARALLIADAPPYDQVDQLRRASRTGGLLERLSGEEPFRRHMIVMAGRGRVRPAFCGRYAHEEGPVYVEASGPWFAQYLDHILQGHPWKPPVGFEKPIRGFDDIELPLALQGDAAIALLGKHRLNPLIRRAAESKAIVVWGADTLSRVDKGIQMGVGVVEMLLIRYAEYVVNKEGILNDLEEGEERLRTKLTEFMALNSGAGRMFRSGSKPIVVVDHKRRTYDVTFRVRFRTVGEKAFVRVVGDETGPKTVEAHRDLSGAPEDQP